jgi:hypothetical protein
MIFAPQTSGYYVLLLVLVPILWMLSDNSSEQIFPKLTIGLLAVLMVPKNITLGSLDSSWSSGNSTFTSLVNPGIGIILLLIVLFSVLKKHQAGKLVARGSS